MGQLRMAGFRHGLLPVAAAVLLATGVAACSSSSSSTSSAGTSNNVAAGGGQCSNVPAGPIKLANIVPLSGPTAQGGQLTEVESDLEVAYFNAHDSVCGHKFVLTNYNDKGDPATSLGIARQIVGEGNTIILEDSLSSAQNQDQPYLMQQHVLVVNGDGAKALFEAQQNPTAFSTLPSNAEYAQLMVNWAKSHGDNNIGILSDGTSFSVELATDAEADVKAAGLTFVKTVTYSPTAIDLTTPLTQAKQAGIQTLFPTGFTGLPAMISGLKQIGWAPKIVGWGGLNDFGITAAQVPPGTVDGCILSYAPGQPTSALLTPENTELLKESQAKIGLNPETSGILGGYMYLLTVKHAIETANSLDGTKLAAALSATSNLPTEVPGLALDWTTTPSVHNGFPSSGLKECDLKQGPYDILYGAS
ncbi:MAG TPA: ABC transporter substrate-binding protein [Streptosporangiaceae bacterium]|nr:ABC transporter substrate-binding protein [Streptosporangiaceae bacterium]